MKKQTKVYLALVMSLCLTMSNLNVSTYGATKQMTESTDNVTTSLSTNEVSVTNDNLEQIQIKQKPSDVIFHDEVINAEAVPVEDDSTKLTPKVTVSNIVVDDVTPVTGSALSVNKLPNNILPNNELSNNELANETETTSSLNANDADEMNEASLPDLQITNLTAKSTQPFTALADTSVSFSFANMGTATANNATFAVLIDGEYFDTYSIDTVAAGESGNADLVIENMSDGTHTIGIYIDYSKAITESDETNNLVSTEFTWNGTPDLVMEKISAKSGSELRAGEKGTLVFQLSNQGNGKVTGPFDVHINVKDMGSFTVNLDASIPGHSSVTFEVGMLPNVCGSYTITTNVDSNGKITESNELNNSYSQEIEIAKAKVITIQGDLSYDIYDHGAKQQTTPLARYSFQVIDVNDGNEVVLANLTTDEAGHFSVNVNNDVSEKENGMDIKFKFPLVNSAARIVDYGERQYSLETNVFKDYGNSSIVFSENLSAVNNLGRGAFNIMHWLNRGREFYSTYANVKQAKVKYYYNQKGNTCCSGGGYWIEYNGIISAQDELDSDIILHEYGHYIQINYLHMPRNAGGSHTYMTPSRDTLAYSEGFAHFFSASVRNENTILDYDGKGGFFGICFDPLQYRTNTWKKDIPINATYEENKKFEARVAATLYRLCTNNLLTFAQINNCVKDPNESMYDFYNSVYKRNYASGKTANIWDCFEYYYVSNDMNLPTIASFSKESGTTYRLKASDDIGITKVEWVADGKIVHSQSVDSSTSVDVNYTYKLSSGDHKLSVNVYDKEGTVNRTGKTSNRRATRCATQSMNETVSSDNSDMFENIKSFFENIFKKKNKEGIKELSQLSSKAGQKTSKLQQKVNFEVKDSNIILEGIIGGIIDQFDIYNQDGEIVYSTDAFNEGNRMELTDLPNGKYTARIRKLLKNKNVLYNMHIFEKLKTPELELPEILNTNQMEIHNTYDTEMVVKVNDTNEVSIQPNSSANIALTEGNNEVDCTLRKSDTQSEALCNNIYVDTLTPELQMNAITIRNKEADVSFTANECLSMVKVNGQELYTPNDLGNINGFTYSVALNDANKIIDVEVVDEAGNVINRSFDISSYFTGGIEDGQVEEMAQ